MNTKELMQLRHEFVTLSLTTKDFHVQAAAYNAAQAVHVLVAWLAKEQAK